MLQLNFDFPFPVLSTDRLILRQITFSDASDFFAMRSNKEIMRYIPRPIAKEVNDVISLIESMNNGITNNELINWGIALKTDNKIIGSIGYFRMALESDRAEIGYLLHANLHGRGIMTEAIKTIITYGFNVMKLHSIEAVIDPRNKASEKLLQKNGFLKEAHFKENFFYEGEYLDSVYYSIIYPGNKI